MAPEQRRAVILDAATGLFASQGYRGTSVDQIADASAVTPPVIYDHFDSKLELYRETLAHHFAALRSTWAEGLAAESTKESVAAAIDGWFAYVEAHPDASRLLFRAPSDDLEIAAVHAEVTAESRAILMPLLAGARVDHAIPLERLDLIWEVLRGGLQGVALWWVAHPDVSREEVAAVAMALLWPGIDGMLGAG